jgi:hypothetical protein
MIINNGDINYTFADGVGDMQAKKQKCYKIEERGPDNSPPGSKNAR